MAVRPFYKLILILRGGSSSKNITFKLDKTNSLPYFLAEKCGMERSVGHHYRCPGNYAWLAKGNPYLTRHCRKSTLATGKTLFAVHDAKNRQTGFYVPEQILAEVKAAESETKDQRKAATKRKDARTIEKARLALHEVFPAIPKEDEEAVLTRAWKKNSRRVGRTEKIEMEVKVKLGVTAHVRHTYTEYDKLLKHGLTKNAAREKVKHDVESIVSKWQGLAEKPTDKSRDSPEVIDLGGSGSEYPGSDSSVEIIATRTLRTKKTAKRKMSETLTSENTATEESIRTNAQPKSTLGKPRNKRPARPAKRAGKAAVPRRNTKPTNGASQEKSRGKGGKQRIKEKEDDH